MVGHRARAAHARVELAEVDLAAILVDQEVQVEVAAIPFLPELIAESERHLASLGAHALAERAGEHLVAAPATLVRRQLLLADDLGEQRADDRAAARDAGFQRRAAAVDAFHDLHFRFADDFPGVLGPIGLVGDEKRRVPGVAESGLDDQIVADSRLGGDLAQMRVAFHARQSVGHARHASLVADANRFHLVVTAVAQARRWEPHLDSELLAQRFGLLVEHQERRDRLAAAALDVIDDLLVLEHVIVDVLDAFEFLVRRLLGHEHVWVPPIQAVDVVDVLEVLHPLVDTREVEVGRADEVDRPLVAVEHQPQIGNIRDLVRAHEWILVAEGAGVVSAGVVSAGLAAPSRSIGNAARPDTASAARAAVASATRASAASLKIRKPSSGRKP